MFETATLKPEPIGYYSATSKQPGKARIEDSGLLSELFLVEQGDGGFR